MRYRLSRWETQRTGRLTSRRGPDNRGRPPLISDLKKLFHLAKEIENRKAFLRNLENGKGIQRTIESSLNTEIQSSGNTLLHLKWDERLTKTRNVWYTASLELDPEWDLQDFAVEVTSLGHLLGFGGPKRRLRLTASTLWNMVPWTWLLDYFTNIGDLLNANRGGAPIRIKGMCLMVKDLDVVVPVNVQAPAGVEWALGYLERETKRRYVIGVPNSPRVSFKPFLTDGQASIIGSLALATALRRFA